MSKALQNNSTVIVRLDKLEEDLKTYWRELEKVRLVTHNNDKEFGMMSKQLSYLVETVNKINPITKDEVEIIVKKTVHETLITLGFPEHPQEVQKHMAFLADEYKAKKETKREIKNAFIRWAIPPIAIGLWETFKHLLK